MEFLLIIMTKQIIFALIQINAMMNRDFILYPLKINLMDIHSARLDVKILISFIIILNAV